VTGSEPPIAQECVEGYLFATPPLRLLIFRRPPNRGSIWVPVSGKVDRSDRDYPSALRRELSEETGLAGDFELTDLDWEVRFDGPDGRPWRLHSFGVHVPASFVPVLSAEHDASEWVSPDEARHRLHYEDNRAAVVRLLGRIRGDVPPSV
jgi:8-oxo-dGTP pyrophosphatase MutT (NUDIX family)